MVEWCLCNTAAATASWGSVDLDEFFFFLKQHQTTGLVETVGRAARTGGKRQPAWCFAIASMAHKLLHGCTGAHARVHVYFLRRVCMHFDRCCEHHACAGAYVKQVWWTSAYTFAYTLATGCAYAFMYVQFVHLALGNEDGELQLSYKSTRCLAWGVILTEGKIGVLSVSSLFLTRVGVYVGVCVCICTHTHTLHRWGTRLWAQESGWDTWRAQRI